MEWSLEKDDMVCVQKSAYVHANNVLKILFAGGHLICLHYFCLWSSIILARVKSIGGCPYCQKEKKGPFYSSHLFTLSP